MEDTLAPYFARIDGTPLRSAFSARRAVMPWRARQAVPPADLQKTWSAMQDAPVSARGRLAYIHVPFCANHCLFCGFYRNACVPPAMADFADRLVREIERDAAAARAGQGSIEALYLGGGTPSALSAAQLARILATARRALPLAPDCEITLEARITHFDEDKIDACLQAGVNRISVGIQSFDTGVRRRQGRQSDRDSAIRFLETLRARPDLALVIDLLYGLPGQTPEVWREDLRTAIALAPDGIDLYGLNLIPGTPLHRAAAQGKFPDIAPLESLGDMYRVGVECMAQAGWRQLSNSHWQGTARERNRYNRLIKEGLDCLAFGPGAGGQSGRHNYLVETDLQAYGAAVQAGRKPLAGITLNDALQDARHLVTAGFEAGRLDLAAVRQSAPPAAHAPMLALARQWQAAGLLDIDADALLLTVPGRFWCSNLIFAFDALLGGGASRPAAGGVSDPAWQTLIQRPASKKEMSQ